MDFTVPTDRWVKLKESKKWDKYLVLAREQKKYWAFGRVSVGFVEGLEDLEFTTPDEHHAKRKPHQNRKRIGKHFSTLCYHTFENSFLVTLSFPPFSLPLPFRHHNIDKVLRLHIIVNIFSRGGARGVMVIVVENGWDWLHFT